MPKAYSYLRFSRPEQMKGDSKRRQTDKAQEYAAAHGLDLDTSLSFHDLGISAFRGSNIETGMLGKFLRAVEDGLVEQGSFLLVESLDRISRQTARKAMQTLESICEAGVTVVTLTDGKIYDKASLDDTMSLLMSLLIFVRANEESEMKAGRLKAAWSNKRANLATKPLTSKCPHWLTLNKDSNRYEIVPERAELVRRIFDMYMAGNGPSGIAKTLNQEGLKPWGRGSLWFESYVTKILQSHAVYGVFIPHKLDYSTGKKERVPLDPVANYFPAVVHELVFQQAQNLRQSKGFAGKKLVTELVNLLSGLGKCPECGSSMINVNKSGGFQYLVCSAAKNGAGCKYVSVRFRPVMSDLMRILKAGLPVPVDELKVKRLEKERKAAEERMNKNIQERTNLIDMIKAGAGKLETVLYEDLPQSVLTAKIEEGPVYAQKPVSFTVRDEIEMLDQAVEASRKRIAALNQQINLIRPAVVLQKVKELQVSAIKESSVDEINALLKSICSSVVVDHTRDVLTFHFKHTDLTQDVPLEMGRAN